MFETREGGPKTALYSVLCEDYSAAPRPTTPTW
jgi:hypothetical protein